MKKVAVIGGGLSGLVVARKLVKAGLSVVVFERSDGVGGLLRSIEMPGGRVDAHYHHLFPGDKAAACLLRQLGLAKRLRFHAAKSGVVKGSVVIPFSTPRDVLALPFLTLVERLRLGVFSLFLPWFAPPRLLNRFTAEKVISVLMGKRVWGQIWEPLFLSKFGDQAHLVSGAWFWARLKTRLTVRRKDGELFGYLKGGFESLALALRDEIILGGGKVRINRQVTHVVKKKGKYLIGREQFDIVVSTVPEPVFEKIVPEATIPKVEYMGFVGALVESSSSLTDRYWISVLEREAPFTVVVSQTNLTPGIIGRGRSLMYLGRYEDVESKFYAKSDFELGCDFVKYLEKIFPGGASAISEIRIVRERYAQPVIGVGYKTPQFLVAPGLYVTSPAFTFPYDRGVNHTIIAADSLAKRILEDLS